MSQAHSVPASSIGQPYRGDPPHDSPDGAALCDAAERREMIAQAAYFRARRRGFTSGHELEDWLVAESEVDTALTIGVPQ